MMSVRLIALQGGQVDRVLGTMLQSCQFWHLLKLLLTGFTLWDNIEKPFQVVRGHL